MVKRFGRVKSRANSIILARIAHLRSSGSALTGKGRGRNIDELTLLLFFSLASLLQILAELFLPSVEFIGRVGCQVSDGGGTVGHGGRAKRPHQRGRWTEEAGGEHRRYERCEANAENGNRREMTDLTDCKQEGGGEGKGRTVQ